MTLHGFRLANFDTASEVTVYKDDRFIILTTGSLINRDAVRRTLGLPTKEDTELALQMYRKSSGSLSNLDGHFAFVL